MGSDERWQYIVYTIRELIDQWPTISGFAKDIGVGYEAARKMRDRGRIDQTHWAAVIGAAKTRGIVDGRRCHITLEKLMELSARRERGAKKSARNEGRIPA